MVYSMNLPYSRVLIIHSVVPYHITSFMYSGYLLFTIKLPVCWSLPINAEQGLPYNRCPKYKPIKSSFHDNHRIGGKLNACKCSTNFYKLVKSH